MSEVLLPVAEVFGPVWQGEGPHTGRRCAFIRLGHCNLSCEWCDTPYTWDRTRYDVDAEAPPTDISRVVAQVERMDVPMVVISGGEPLIHQHQPAWSRLLFGLRHHSVHVETNGTIPPTPDTRTGVEFFSVSPKVSTHDPEKRRLRPNALAAFSVLAQQGRAAWKFVAQTEADVDVAAALCDEWSVPPRARWIMPEGTDADTLLARARDIAPAVTRHRMNFTIRDHALMFGAARGV